MKREAVTFEAYHTFKGWAIQMTKGTKHYYLHSCYRGEFKMTTDFLYQKFYTTKASAEKVIEKMKGEIA